MKIDLEQLKQDALSKINKVIDKKELEDIRVNYLGKKSEINQYLKELQEVSVEDKKQLGLLINDAKSIIENSIKEKMEIINKAYNDKKLLSEQIDVTLTPIKKLSGHLNPITKVYLEIKNIFENMGYVVVTGPEMEDADYNFTKLKSMIEREEACVFICL